jgi:hypothetical protein
VFKLLVKDNLHLSKEAACDFTVCLEIYLCACWGMRTSRTSAIRGRKFTATRINRALGRDGRFWQDESFDHLVRSEWQFDYLRRYIAENPQAAKLRDGEYLYWRRGELCDRA